MFTKEEELYLKRQLANNQAILFIGAGFSRDAKNKLGENFPSGRKLGEKLWKFLSYPGEYDNTPLHQMFQAFTKASIKKDKKIDFLNSNLLSQEIPPVYGNVTIPYWFKIYTVNIDDVLTSTYRIKQKTIEELVFPKDEYSERDQSLEKTQIIYLHGKLPCEIEEVIFSTQQYAKAHLAHQPLYGQFVYDYATLPTVFIGTELDEQIFEKYIEAREGKYGFRELRPKSFIITPNLSPVKIDNFRNNYNVHYIQGTSESFLNWLDSIKNELPEKKEILKNTFPNLLDVLEYADLTGTSKKSILLFSKSFRRVPKEIRPIKERSGYLLGTSPRWNDIVRELDVPRTINTTLISEIEKIENKNHDKINIISLIGSAGSGKSTILKRLGIQLSQKGNTVFLSYSDFIPKPNEITEVISNINEQVIILFDNARNVLHQLPLLIETFLKELKRIPIIILAIRTNFSTRLNEFINPVYCNRIDFRIPDLDDIEIRNLIEKLDENNLLGVLKGKTDYERFKEFKYRAHRQILVAMKEATNGKSFGEIINEEFELISPIEAKILCLCIALNTEVGFTNSKQDIIGFSNSSPNEALSFLENALNGTIMWVGNGSRFMLRHRILADYMINSCASLELLKESYIRVLSILAPELKKTFGPTRKFNLFKSLIDHKVLYKRFESNIDHAREVYDSITDHFSDSSHFWLQYGSLEVEGKGGDLSLAENYLIQAESLAPDSTFIQNAKCNLYYRLAHATSNYAEALQYKEFADDLAKVLLISIGKEDPYIYHIYCGGRYKFTSKWTKEKSKKKEELLELKKTIKTALTNHPFNDKLKIVSDAIERAYIHLGIGNDLEDPEIPDFN